MINKTTIVPSSTQFAAVFLSLVFLFFNSLAFAEAGRVVFVSGSATAENSNGVVRRLYKRDYVEAGDTIKTSRNSMIQMRMIDKAIIALRSNSEVKIDAYNLGATKEDDVSIFSLLRGGLRSVTGIIGKRFRKSFSLRTITATIGIRGTDFTARLCNNDCNQNFGGLGSTGSIADGLYVGVNEGGIDLTNNLGTLSLDELQFGYVKDAGSAPVALVSAPEFLYFNSKAPNPDEQSDNNEAEPQTQSQKKVTAARSAVEPDSTDVTSNDTIKQDLKVENIEVAQEQIEQNTAIDQTAVTSSGSSFSLNDGTITSSRMVVTTYGSQTGAGSLAKASSNPFGSANVVNKNLTKFDNGYLGSTNGVGVYTSGNSETIDLGYDPVTGIAWGRWSAGQAQVQPTGTSSAPNASDFSSVHWMVSPDQTQNIALPSNGTVSYNLAGNTTPTDNLGNSGVLGNATLDANFNNMTVDTSVSIGITSTNQVWNASASNLAIGQNGRFAGNMDSVNINTGNSAVSGTGKTAGFITNNATGAGMGFSLEANINGVDTTVSGTAAFQK